MSYMQFDEGGQRINFTLEIYEPIDNYVLATWSPNGHISQKVVEMTNIKKIIYKVATRIGEPYFMLKYYTSENSISPFKTKVEHFQGRCRKPHRQRSLYRICC